MILLSLICATLFLLVGKLFLAGKDSTSYLLKEKSDNALTKTRIKRWHRDGVALDILLTAPVAYILGPNWWQVCIISALLRLAYYDPAFNYWAKLDFRHLGSTAWWDRQFIKIFGMYGAVRKSIFFTVLIILFLMKDLIFNF